MKLTNVHRRSVMTSLIKSMIEKREAIDRKIATHIEGILNRYIKKEILDFVEKYPGLIRYYVLHPTKGNGLLPEAAYDTPIGNVRCALYGTDAYDLTRSIYYVNVKMVELTYLKDNNLIDKSLFSDEGIDPRRMYPTKESVDEVMSLCKERSDFLQECIDALSKVSLALAAFSTTEELLEIFPEFKSLLEKHKTVAKKVSPPKPAVDRKSLINTLSSLKVLPGQNAQES